MLIKLDIEEMIRENDRSVYIDQVIISIMSTRHPKPDRILGRIITIM
jgi:hypothetical protein